MPVGHICTSFGRSLHSAGSSATAPRFRMPTTRDHLTSTFQSTANSATRHHRHTGDCDSRGGLHTDRQSSLQRRVITSSGLSNIGTSCITSKTTDYQAPPDTLHQHPGRRRSRHPICTSRHPLSLHLSTSGTRHEASPEL